MSHVSKIRFNVKFKDRNTLIETLREFGEVITNNAFVTSYEGRQRTSVDIALKIGDRQQIGFRYNRQLGEYEMIGDLYNCGIRNPYVVIPQTYTEKAIAKALRMKGYTVRKQKEGVIVGVKA